MNLGRMTHILHIFFPKTFDKGGYPVPTKKGTLLTLQVTSLYDTFIKILL